MSLLSRLISGVPVRPQDDTPEQKVQDPANPGRLVTPKPANKPFLAHQRYREKQDKARAQWMDRQKERQEKIARGEPVGPPERDPTAGKELGVLALLKVVFVLLVTASLAGKFVVDSYTWGYEGKWVQVKTYWPAKSQLFTDTQLAQYDGSDPAKPIYLAVDGEVYDVSANRRTYGPGGSYSILAGAEGGRSFATGCFLTHKTHDYRGLTDREMKSVNHWKNFFAEHKDYFKVGRLLHKPIDPASPVPVHCDPKKQEAIEKREAEKEAAMATAAQQQNDAHTEL